MARWVDMDTNPCYKCRLVEECIPWESDKKCIDHYNWFKGADVAPVKHGHWDDVVIGKLSDSITLHIHMCSVCGYESENEEMNYCPNCGANMKGERDD